jgi:hypothetical protein
VGSYLDQTNLDEKVTVFFGELKINMLPRVERSSRDLAGPLRLRVDYRVFVLGSAPDAAPGDVVQQHPQRFSVGLNIAAGLVIGVGWAIITPDRAATFCRLIKWPNLSPPSGRALLVVLAGCGTFNVTPWRETGDWPCPAAFRASWANEMGDFDGVTFIRSTGLRDSLAVSTR